MMCLANRGSCEVESMVIIEMNTELGSESVAFYSHHNQPVQSVPALRRLEEFCQFIISKLSAFISDNDSDSSSPGRVRVTICV